MLIAPDWIERHCVVPDSFERGAPFNLYDYQFRFFVNHYLVKGTAEWIPEKPLLGPAFVYRRSLLVGPQKIGKGPHTAAHICLESVGPALFAGWAEGDDVYDCAEHGCPCGWVYEYEPGEPKGMPWPTPLIQLTAYSEEQTDNVYGALRPMIDNGPLSEVITKTGEEFIRLPGGGRIDTVTSSAMSRLGQRVTFVPQDEVGLWNPTNKMTKVADTQYRGLAGMGGRAALTTNAWDPSEDSVAQREYESQATDIYRQFLQPPKHLSYKNKAERRKIHQAVYEDTLRSRGGHIDLDSIEAEAADLVAKDPAQAERFYGNRIVYGLGTWLPDDLWDNTAADVTVPDGAQVCLGFDGSESNDWTAIRAETLDGHRFTPTYGPDNRPTVWNPEQWPGGVIPRGEVAAAVDELFRKYNVKLMYCDPPLWHSEIGEWSLAYGDKRVLEWSTFRVSQMHDALERSLTDLSSGKSTHDRCKLAELCAANARKAAKTNQRYILGKPSPAQKIDVIMADALAHEAAADARADGWGVPTTNYYYGY